MKDHPTLPCHSCLWTGCPRLWPPQVPTWASPESAQFWAAASPTLPALDGNRGQHPSSAPRLGALGLWPASTPLGPQPQNAPLRPSPVHPCDGLHPHFLCFPLSLGPCLKPLPPQLSIPFSRRPAPQDSHDSGSLEEPCVALPGLPTLANLSAWMGFLSPDDLQTGLGWPCSTASSPKNEHILQDSGQSPPGSLPQDRMRVCQFVLCSHKAPCSEPPPARTAAASSSHSPFMFVGRPVQVETVSGSFPIFLLPPDQGLALLPSASGNP